MNAVQGYWCLVLHAHLPYIRHPEFPDFLEEDWFFEALTETYIPVLDFSWRLAEEGVRFKYTINLSPTLCAMMQDELLQSRYKKKLHQLIELSEKELDRTRHQTSVFPVAKMYEQKLKRCLQIYEKWHHDITRGFKALQEAGHIEIITCCATHGFLPLMIDARAQAAQIRAGVQAYRNTFGRDPHGIWLAECAYSQGIESLLAEQKIRYFFLDQHGLTLGTPRPKYGTFAPIMTSSGVAAFGRDHETAEQVWSAEQGYPGDARYREFYRDLGYDLDYETVKPYLHDDAVRRNIGLKYHRITGKTSLDKKEFYNPEWARQAAGEHAGNFVFNRQIQARHLRANMDRPPIIVSMYDAELYGHWWYEGPEFLEYIFKKIHYDQNTIECVTPSEYLEKFPQNESVQPADSSWGDKGYYEVWLNQGNDWIYKHLHKIAEKMIFWAEKISDPTDLERRALNQMAREVLLAQSSDWAFLMTTNTAKSYSEKRTKDHIHRFLTLEREFSENKINPEFLRECEWKDNIFSDLDYKIFRGEYF